MGMMAPEDPMAALLGGGGGPPMGGDPMGGAPPTLDIPSEESSSDPVESMRQALDLVRSAAEAEVDDEDQAALEKIGAQIAAYIGSQQKLTDTATGAGPGAKLVRKAAAGQGGGAPAPAGPEY